MSSSANPTAHIEDLPLEMICELFEYLPPKDLAACSMVNKRWHSIYAAFKLHRLAAIDYDPEYDLIKWHGSNRPIQEAERCGPAMFRRLAEKPLLSNLKHLILFGSFKFDLNKLNRFRQLVHLEINIDLDEEVQLNLPKLKVLAFHCDNSRQHCALSIDCPELSTLAYYEHGQANLLDVKHPETIRVLETNLVGQQLAPFKSVESLEAWEFKAISKATLLSLPNLRELRYDQDIEHLVCYEFDSAPGTVDRVKRTLSEFLGEAKKLRGSDFRFIFAGLQLTNVKADQIDFGLKVDEHGEWVSNEYVYMKNYHLIEPDALDFVWLIDYTQLLSNVTGEFPRCFSQKFTGIEKVEVHGVVKDPDHLLWFLKSLRFLRELELRNVKFSQKFYDRLPAAARSLVSLYLFDQCWKAELQLNFDFIGEFTVLSKLTITEPLSLESETSLARWLGPLKEAHIYVRPGRDLWIKKAKDSALWKIQDPKQHALFETENPGKLVSFFAGFRAALLETSI